MISQRVLVDGEEFGSFTISSPTARVCMNEISDDSRDNNTGIGYSGRHDSGLLPQLREGGPHAEVIGAVFEAKQKSDAIFLSIVNQYSSGNTQSKRICLQDSDNEDDNDNKDV